MLEQVLESAINRVLRLDAHSLRRLGELEGKTIRVDLDGEPPLTLFVFPSGAGLRLRRRHEHGADVTLRGSLPLLARLARTGIAAGELQISGDVELGSRFKRILEDIDPDFEEPLARVLGDPAAHALGRAARGAFDWGRHAAQALARDVTEYLQEESRVLAPRARVEEFMRAVDRLRADADRLEQRVQRLAGRRP